MEYSLLLRPLWLLSLLTPHSQAVSCVDTSSRSLSQWSKSIWPCQSHPGPAAQPGTGGDTFTPPVASLLACGARPSLGSFQPLPGSLGGLCGSAQQGMGGSTWSGAVSPQDRLLLLSMTKPELMLLLSSDLPGGLTGIPVTILHPPPSSGQARTLHLSGVPTFVGSQVL